MLACKNSHLAPLLATRNILLGETYVPQQQKFNTDEVNQCLHIKLINLIVMGFQM